MLVPEPLNEASQFLKGFRASAVEPLRSSSAHTYQPCRRQHLEMLRNGRASHVKMSSNFPRREFPVLYQQHDLPSTRLRNRL